MTNGSTQVIRWKTEETKDELEELRGAVELQRQHEMAFREKYFSGKHSTEDEGKDRSHRIEAPGQKQ